MDTYDVIVIGLGAMGSAATYQLAKGGANVLGIDQYSPPHVLGSSHGDTRITRLAVGEGAEYFPLVQRSNELWRSIEQETGKTLLNQCGGLIMGIADTEGQHGVKDFVDQTISVANEYGVAHETLSTEEIHRRYPQFNVTSEKGYYEPEAGYLMPENCVSAQLELADKYGATLKTDEKVLSWHSNNETVTVVTNKGEYNAKKLILAAGSWINDLIPEYAQQFKVYRQVLYWFDIKSNYESFRDMPVYIWVYGKEAGDYTYGFPAIDGKNGGVKIACEDYSILTSPDEVERLVTNDETMAMYERHIKDQFPDLSDKCVKSYACMYTVTSDFKFVIDSHPRHSNVIVASPCSGHGFKHSAAIGEILSQLVIDGSSKIDISKFSFQRLIS